LLCSLNWLAEYVKLTLEPEELAQRLTMAGLEAKAWPRYEARPEGVVAARLVAVEPHPNSDRLKVCRVEAGGQELNVVCGAPNLWPGMISPLALVGARLPGGVKVEKSLIREVESRGMLLAEDELGLSEDHSALLELDPKTRPGTPLEELIRFEDYLLEVDLTPNRGDCASVLGLAREAAAICGTEAVCPELNYPESGPPADQVAAVIVHEPELCPRYAASLLSGLKVGRSPWWMRDRLISGGVRPISNLVDVTNFILLEMNQPLHAFDFDRLEGGRIEVRCAKDGQVFTTLDGQHRRLDKDALLICDAERAVGLAGIMGGLNSEVVAETERVLIEAAYFDPTSIRRTSTRLGLSTEASYRFERGMDYEGLIKALRRATRLMNELGGGRVHPGLIDVYPKRLEPPRLTLRPERCNALLGTSLSPEAMAGHLNSIQVQAGVSDGLIRVEVPTWRPDLTREVDLIEEVARLHGYDEVPITLPPMTGAAEAKPALDQLRDRIRPLLTTAGLYQIITYSFIPATSARTFGWSEQDRRGRQVPLLNPLSEDQAALRTSLLHGLISNLAYNLRQGTWPVRIFEWGNVFYPRGQGELPQEECHLAGLICGRRQPVAWYDRGEGVDFWDLKGLVERVLDGLGLKGADFRPVQASEYLPGAAAEVWLGQTSAGRLGQLNPTVLEAFDLKEPVWAFDLSAETLVELTSRLQPAFSPLPRFPSITHDLALVVERDLPAGRILEWASEIDDPLIVETVIFDLYQGQPLQADEKSIGLRVRYRSPEKTLTEEEILPLHGRLTAHLLEHTNGRLRK